jgi:hypothetical protein
VIVKSVEQQVQILSVAKIAGTAAAKDASWKTSVRTLSVIAQTAITAA